MSCALRVSSNRNPQLLGVRTQLFPIWRNSERNYPTSRPHGYAIQCATTTATTAQPGAQLLALNTAIRSCVFTSFCMTNPDKQRHPYGK